MALAPATLGAVLRGRVIEIVDGDTLTIALAEGGRRVQVRLLTIDAPEGRQALGKMAQFNLASLCANHQVSVDTSKSMARFRVSVTGSTFNPLESLKLAISIE